MSGTRSNRGSVTAFLNAETSWIKANLHRQQCDIAAELMDRVPAGQPRIDLPAMKVALYRWLEKRGWSDKHLRAIGVECVLRDDSSPARAVKRTDDEGKEPSSDAPSPLQTAPSIVAAEGNAGSHGLPLRSANPAPPRSLTVASSGSGASGETKPVTPQAAASRSAKLLPPDLFAPARDKGGTL